MKDTLSEYDFTHRFMQIRPNNFSYDGLRALFAALEDYEESTGSELEFDPVAICCDFSEYADIEEFRSEYGDEYESVDDIHDQTWVIEIPGSPGFIIQAF